MASSAMKIGPWGARGGRPCDIKNGSKPVRLESFSIRSAEYVGGRIYGFSFTYVDQKGESINAGPWGTITSIPGIKPVILEDGGQVHHVSGTADSNGVTSLYLETNQCTYGPFGYPSGTVFSVPLQQGKGQVVGFFGNAGDTLKALGVYVPGKKSSPVKAGPWGVSAGGATPRDINQAYKPENLESITVRSSENPGGRIYGFSFTYADQNGQSIHVGPWGPRNKGVPQQIELEEDEYVNLISGTTDSYGVTSLKFQTNQCTYGPYGVQKGTAFSVPLQQGSGAAVAFFGCFGDGLLSLGAYITPHH